jgi:hypothetical protein
VYRCQVLSISDLAFLLFLDKFPLRLFFVKQCAGLMKSGFSTAGQALARLCAGFGL